MAKQENVGINLALVGKGRVSAELLPLVEEVVAGMERSLENRIFQGLAAGTLTPEVALYAWIEKSTYKTLLKRLTTHILVGQSAAQAVAPFMAEKENENG